MVQSLRSVETSALDQPWPGEISLALSYLSLLQAPPATPAPSQPGLDAAGGSSEETRRPQREPRRRGLELHRSPNPGARPAALPRRAAPRGHRPDLTRCGVPTPESPVPSADRKWAADAVKQVCKKRGFSVSSLGLSEVRASRWSLVPGTVQSLRGNARVSFLR